MADLLLDNEPTHPAAPDTDKVLWYSVNGAGYTKDSDGVERRMFGEEEVTDAYIGERTINDATVPSDDTDTVGQLLSMLGNRIKAITGKTNWYDNPDSTIALLKNALLYSPQGSGLDVYTEVVVAPSSDGDTVVFSTNEYASAPQVWTSIEGSDALTPIVTRVVNKEVDEVTVRWYQPNGLTPGQFTLKLFAIGVPA